MSENRTLKRGMLRSCNQVRMAFNSAPLYRLPVGRKGQAYDCSGHRALDDLALGSFAVESEHLLVDQRFAAIIAATWGTGVVACTCKNQPCGQVHVVLPQRMTRFIAAFDEELIPELLDPRPADELVDA